MSNQTCPQHVRPDMPRPKRTCPNGTPIPGAAAICPRLRLARQLLSATPMSASAMPMSDPARQLSDTDSAMTDSEAPISARVLVVDDDPMIRRVVQDRFKAQGYETDTAKDGNDALTKLDEFEPDLMLLDLRMPGKDGYGVLEALQGKESAPAVVVITAHGSIEAAVKAMRMGATDFIPKPFEPVHLQHVVSKALQERQLRRRVVQLQTELSSRHSLVAGKSDAMHKAMSLTARASKSNATVLLLGESGSGKEVLARFLHAQSPRADGPFIAVNCATLGKELLESELFGHEKGAFTGAQRSKPGRIEQAAGGTLFLDEIGELDPSIQAKLLRVLQEREFERVGGTRTIQADVRIVCATHRDLSSAISDGRFREDLYYRINVVNIRVPPLRERPDDISALIDHFLNRHAQETGRTSISLEPKARELLLRYAWPGNVRELSNVVERMVVLSAGDNISVDDVPEELHDADAPTNAARPSYMVVKPDTEELPSYHDAVREAKRLVLREALERNGNVQTHAARALGITQPYMARLMKNLDVKLKR